MFAATKDNFDSNSGHYQSSFVSFENKLRIVETDEYENSFYAVVATTNIRKGDAIWYCYGNGEETSIDIYTKYGFLPTGNEENDIKAMIDFGDEWGSTDDNPSWKWSTSLEQDEEELRGILQNDNSREAFVKKEILNLRIYVKKLQQKKMIKS